MLDVLYHGKPEDHKILVWTLPNKHSVYCSTVSESLEVAAKVAKDCDVYFGVGTASKVVSGSKRWAADKIEGIPALWADIDYGDSSKKRHPLNRETADKIIAKFPYPPTITVHSGHGLQCYWVFKEYWTFDTEQDNAMAANMAKRFSIFANDIASEFKCVLDSVCDLSRVMRVPNTTNRKGVPVPVVVEKVDSALMYNPEDFDEILPDVRAVEVTKAGNLVIDEGAAPPPDKWLAMMENSTKFRMSWERTRKDLKDSSASGYDYSLASMAKLAGWTDQEIVNLMIANRKKHGDALKLRESYYVKTMERLALDKQLADIEEELPVIHAESENDAEDRVKTLAYLSDLFGVKINNIIRYMTDPPKFRIETENGGITLGNVEGLISQQAFRMHLTAYCKGYFKNMKTAKWAAVVQAMLRAMEDREVDFQGKDFGKITVAILEYLNVRPPIKNPDEACMCWFPYESDGVVYFHGTDFRKWMGINYHGRDMWAKDMGVMLRTIGAEPAIVHMNTTLRGHQIRNMWRLPATILEARKNYGIQGFWTAGNRKDDVPGWAGEPSRGEVRVGGSAGDELHESGGAGTGAEGDHGG